MQIPERITVEEAAERTQKSVATIRRWAKSGRIAAKKLGKEWAIDPSGLPSPPDAPRSRRAAKVDLALALKYLRSEDLRNPWVPDVLMWKDFVEYPEHSFEAAQRIFDGGQSVEPPIEVDVPKTAFFTRSGQMLPIPEALAYQAAVTSFVDRAERRRSPRVFSAHRAEDKQARLLEEGVQLWKRWKDDVIAGIKGGYKFMLSTDVTAYYDCIPHSLLMAEVETYVDDPSVVAALRRMLSEWSFAHEGIPQGPDASRVLGNLYLYPVDEALEDSRWQYSRYMDDIRILAKSRRDALAGLRLLERECKRRRLVLSPQKTELLIGQKAIDDFEDPSLNSARFWWDRKDDLRARRALRKVLDKAIDRSGNVRIRRARFSLYRLWMSRDRYRVSKVLHNLEHLGPVAKHAVTYLRPWLENAQVQEEITSYLEDPNRNTSPFMEAWLFAALMEYPRTLPASWTNHARRIMNDANADGYIRELAMSLVARGATPTDVQRLEEFATKNRYPSLARAALVALARARRLRPNVTKAAVARHGELEATIKYLKGRNRLPSLIYGGQMVSI